MKKLLLLLGLVLTTNAFSEELTLSCHGQAEVSDTSLFLDGEFGMLLVKPRMGQMDAPGDEQG